MVVLRETLKLLAVSVRKDFVTDCVASCCPSDSLLMMVMVRGKSACAVERDPAHGTGVDKRLRFATNFPDTAVEFLPVVSHVVSGTFRKRSQISDGCAGMHVTAIAAIAYIAEGRVEQFTEDIHLFLGCGAITDSHRL